MGGAEGEEDRNLSILCAKNVLSTKGTSYKGRKTDMFEYMNCLKLTYNINTIIKVERRVKVEDNFNT